MPARLPALIGCGTLYIALGMVGKLHSSGVLTVVIAEPTPAIRTFTVPVGCRRTSALPSGV